MSSLFLTRVGVYVGVSVGKCTHTHTAHAVLDVSPWVGTRHIEGLKNPEILNRGKCLFVHVYKVHMCTSMLKDGMRSGLIAFFLEHICSSEKFKQKV